MVLKVISSGSHGNCYLLEAANGEKLILECGVAFRTIKQALKFDLRGVCGCLVSHRHKDHSKSLLDILKAGIKTLALEDVFVSQSVKNRSFCETIEPNGGYKIGGFSIFAFDVLHDVPCIGFIISHKEMGRLLFATDTMNINYRFPKMNHILIEANYDDAILQKNIDEGRIPASMRKRLMESHMEIEACKNILRENDLSDVNEIVLIHLSGNNSDASDFINQVKATAGKPVFVASQGLELSLNLTQY